MNLVFWRPGRDGKREDPYTLVRIDDMTDEELGRVIRLQEEMGRKRFEFRDTEVEVDAALDNLPFK